MANQITSLDAAMTLWFHVVAHSRGASERGVRCERSPPELCPLDYETQNEPKPPTLAPRSCFVLNAARICLGSCFGANNRDESTRRDSSTNNLGRHRHASCGYEHPAGHRHV